MSHSAFIGISRHHLGRVVAELAGPWQARRESGLRQRRGRDRLRAEGAGRRHDLVFTDRVLVTLAVLRLQIPHAALAVMYGVHRSTVTRAVREVRPLLAGRGYATPAGPRLHTLADVFAYAAARGIRLRMDGSEIQVRRPKAGRPGRRAFVSGKKKQNTIKFTKICDERGRTLGDVTFRPGRMHDQTALQTDGIDDLLEQFPDVAGRDGRRLPGPAPRPPRPGQRPAEETGQERAAGGDPGLGTGPPRPVLGADLRGARHRRQQALAAPAALDRPARGPAGDGPGDRLAGVRPRRRLVTRRHRRSRQHTRARTPRT